MCDILEDDPSHGLGWIKWSDRVFYVTDEGIVKTLTEFWGPRVPGVVNQFVALMRIAKHRRVRSALRVAQLETSGAPLVSSGKPVLMNDAMK